MGNAPTNVLGAGGLAPDNTGNAGVITGTSADKLVSQVGLITTLNDINPTNLKANYLFGIEFLDDSSNPYPDSFFWHWLSKGLSEVERAAKIAVIQRPINDEMHDYDVRDYAQFAYLELFMAPALSVQQVTLVYPTGQAIFTIPPQWIRFYPDSGKIHLVPTQGSLSSVILGQGGTYLPLIYQGMGYLPQLFHVNYMAGMDRNNIPYTVADAIFKMACLEILRVAGDVLYPPGTASQSISIDGISKSRSVVQSPFKNRLEAYRDDLYGDGRTRIGLLKELKDQYHGIDMRVA